MAVTARIIAKLLAFVCIQILQRAMSCQAINLFERNLASSVCKQTCRAPVIPVPQ